MRLNSIKPNDAINGEGIVVSVWVQGCPHKCKGCHNRETWLYRKGEKFTEKHQMQILEMLDANGVNRNLSILGGEPLTIFNIKGVIRLCKFIKENRPNTKIYVWTGYPFEVIRDWELGNPILKYIDYMIDGKYVESEKDLKLFLRGSKNQRVIDVKETLENNSIKLHPKC